MRRELRDRLLGLVARHYLTSRDFNGITLAEVAKDLGSAAGEICELVSELGADGLVDLAMSGHGHVNIHIKAVDLPPWEHLITLLPEADPYGVCLYPSARHLAGIVDRSHYAGTPFTEKLALGEPQLRHVAFDLTVLERYRNDPVTRSGTTTLPGASRFTMPTWSLCVIPIGLRFRTSGSATITR